MNSEIGKEGQTTAKDRRLEKTWQEEPVNDAMEYVNSVVGNPFPRLPKKATDLPFLPRIFMWLFLVFVVMMLVTVLIITAVSAMD